MTKSEVLGIVSFILLIAMVGFMIFRAGDVSGEMNEQNYKVIDSLRSATIRLADDRDKLANENNRLADSLYTIELEKERIIDSTFEATKQKIKDDEKNIRDNVAAYKPGQLDSVLSVQMATALKRRGKEGDN